MPLRIEVPQAEIARYCRENKIARLRAFGSVLRDDFTPESDVDLLVAFEPNARISLLDYVRIKRELSELLGRDVDLVSEKGISKYIRDEVFAEAEAVFAADAYHRAGSPAATGVVRSTVIERRREPRREVGPLRTANGTTASHTVLATPGPTTTPAPTRRPDRR